MLSKLLKHEWKSTWKFPAALSLFILLMTVAGCLAFRLPTWQKLINNSVMNLGDTLAVLLLVAYFISIIVAAFVIMIYFAIRFYRNLYGDEGYLMHTLPVTPRALILSKTLVSGLWCLITTVLILISVYALIFFFIKALVPADVWPEITATFSALMPEMAVVFEKQTGMPIWLTFALIGFYIVISNFISMLLIYACISIGQLFHKHKVAASILSYLVVTSIVQTFMSLLLAPVSINMVIRMETQIDAYATPVEIMISPLASLSPLYYTCMVVGILLCIPYYFCTSYIMKQKLNLD